MNIQRLSVFASLVIVACGGTTTTTTEPDTSGDEVTEKAPAAKSGGTATTTPAKSSGGDAKGSDPGTPGDPATPPADGTPGQDGQPGRSSVNEHCCYAGKYYKCPSSAACFGGFDIEACLSTCNDPNDPCFDACFDKLDKAGPPKGCQTNVTPPAGVDCANGQINI